MLYHFTYIVDHIVAGPHLPHIEPVRQGPTHSPARLAHSQSFSGVVVIPAVIRASSNYQDLDRGAGLK